MPLIVSLTPNNYDESDTGITADIRNRFTIAIAGNVGKATIHQLIRKFQMPVLYVIFTPLITV